MRKSANSASLAMIAVLVLAAVFALAVIRSILLRSQISHNYPAYSSLNNGVNGTKAYFDALVRLGFVASRNFKLLPKLTGTRAAVFCAGAELWAFRFSDEKELRQFEQLATRGARVIIALDPAGVIEMPVKKQKQAREPESQSNPDNLKTRWGIELKPKEQITTRQTREFLVKLQLRSVNWQFSSWSKDWVPSHTRNGAPLLLERPFGRGSIVLIGNSKLFTNRELLFAPDTDVLASAPGRYREIVFDESHLGLEDTGTVFGLAVAHRLQWMLLGFLALAVLYIWHSSVSFIPPPATSAEPSIAGRDAHAALSNLLMQSVPLRAILRTCAEEWNQSASVRKGRTRTFSPDDLANFDGLATAHVAPEYRALANRLNPRVTSERFAPL